MYKIMLRVTLMLISLASSSSFAQEFSFKPPSTAIKQGSSSSSIPTRSGSMSPESFKNRVSSTTQNRSAAVSGLAKEKLNNNPEYATKNIPGRQKSPSNLESTTTFTNQAPTKPTTTVPQETPSQPVAAPQTYTGFVSPSPSGGTSPSKKSTDQNSSGGFGNIYQ